MRSVIPTRCAIGSEKGQYMWQNLVNMAVGAWLFVASLLDLSAATIHWSLLVGGIVVAGMALWSTLDEQQHEHTGHIPQPR